MNHNAWPGYPEKHTWLLSALKIDAYPNLTLREPGESIPRRLR
jgi:hypothetical protein